MTTKTKLIDELNAKRVENNEKRIRKNSKMTIAQLRDAIDAYETHVDENDGVLTFAMIAREMNVNPKIARSKLRRHGVYASNSRHATCKRDDALFALYVRVIESKRRDDDIVASLHDALNA